LEAIGLRQLATMSSSTGRKKKPAATTTPSAAVALTPLATPTASTAFHKNRVVQIEVVGPTFDWALTIAAIGTDAASKWIPYDGLANLVVESIQSIREMHKDCADLLVSLEQHLREQDEIIVKMMKRCNSLQTKDDELKAFLVKTIQASVSLLYTISVKCQKWKQKHFFKKLLGLRSYKQVFQNLIDDIQNDNNRLNKAMTFIVDARVESAEDRIVDTIKAGREELLKEIDSIMLERLGGLISAVTHFGINKNDTMESQEEQIFQLRRDTTITDMERSEGMAKALATLMEEVKIADEEDDTSGPNPSGDDDVNEEQKDDDSSEELSLEQQEALELLDGLRVPGVRMKPLDEVIRQNSRFAAQTIDIQRSFCAMLSHLAKRNDGARGTVGEIGWIDDVTKIMRQNLNDKLVQGPACQALSYLLQRPNFNRDIVMGADGIVTILNSLRNHMADPDVIRYGCQALYYLSLFNDDARKAIYDASGVKVLLECIRSCSDFPTEVMTAALSALNNLTYVDLIMQEIESEQGLQIILDGVKQRTVGDKNDVNLFAQLCRTFRIFAMYGNEHRRMIVDEGLKTMLDALRVYGKDPKLQRHGAGALKNLAWNDYDHRYLLVENGAIELLLNVIETFGQYNVAVKRRKAKIDPAVLEQALGALAALLRAADDRGTLQRALHQEAITKVLGLLTWKHRALGVQLSGMKALVHLTTSRIGEDSMAQLSQNDAINCVLMAMSNRYNVEDLQAYSCAFLSNLAQLGLDVDIVRHGGVEAIVRAVAVHAKEVHAAGFFALYNLLQGGSGETDDGREELVGKLTGKINTLVEAMRQSRDNDHVCDFGELILELLCMSSYKSGADNFGSIKLAIEECQGKDPKNVSLQRWGTNLITHLTGKSHPADVDSSPSLQVCVITARDGVVLKKRRI
jgi:hypothetical protein